MYIYIYSQAPIWPLTRCMQTPHHISPATKPKSEQPQCARQAENTIQYEFAWP